MYREVKGEWVREVLFTATTNAEIAHRLHRFESRNPGAKCEARAWPSGEVVEAQKMEIA